MFTFRYLCLFSRLLFSLFTLAFPEELLWLEGVGLPLRDLEFCAFT